LDNFKTEQIFYSSKDGTRVPMFLVSKKVILMIKNISYLTQNQFKKFFKIKTLEKSDQNPVFLYAYGGFNTSLTPSFSVVRLIW
jgi:prolyl oligopeptidase